MVIYLNLSERSSNSYFSTIFIKYTDTFFILEIWFTVDVNTGFRLIFININPQIYSSKRYPFEWLFG